MKLRLLIFCVTLAIGLKGQTKDTAKFNPYTVEFSVLGGASLPAGTWSNEARLGLNDALLLQGSFKHTYFKDDIVIIGQTNGYSGQPIFLNAQNSASKSGLGSSNSEIFISNALLGGVCWGKVLSKFSYNFRLLAGIMDCNLPEINTTNNFGNKYVYSFNYKRAFAYLLGTDMRYLLSRRFSVIASLTYLSSAQVNFKGTDITNISAPQTINANYAFTNILSDIGISYNELR